MPHFDEMTCMQYLDGQLDRARAAELAAHADACAECRRLLGALERESQLLHDALGEEDEAVPARLLTPPSEDKTSWAWITSMGLAAGGLYTLWAGLVSPWLDNLSQAGFGEGNLLTLMFFGGVFWKGWGDMLNLVQTLATGTLVILTIGLLMRLGRRLTTVAMVLSGVCATLLLPAGAMAAEIRKKESVVVPAGETIKNDLISYGGTVRVDGTIEGDLIVFCESVSVNGRVTGDVIAFTRSLRVDGTVDGSIRGFANAIVINNAVNRNLMVFTQQLELGSKGQVGGGVIAFADLITLEGRIGRDVLSFGERTLLNGYIGGDATLQSRRLNIGAATEILGKTKYKGREEASVDPAAKLASPLEYEKVTRRPDYASGRFYWRQALSWGAAFVLGLVVTLLFPGFLRETLRTGNRPGASALAGLVALFLIPVLAIVACITLVGMGVGLISIVLWISLVYAAQVFFGAWLGGKMLGAPQTTGAVLGRLAAGLLVIRIAGNLPFTVGGWVWFVVIVMGMGIFLLTTFERIRGGSAPAVQPAV